MTDETPDVLESRRVEGLVAAQEKAIALFAEVEKRGLVTRIRSYPLPDGTVAEQMFLAPPLVITEEQVDRILEIVRASIKAVLPTQP